MKIVSDTLRKLRKGTGLSQQGLAERADVDKKTVARIEGGKGGEARQETVQRLAKALGVEPKVLAAEHSPDSKVDGYLGVRVYVRHETMLAYDLVEDRYGVDIWEIIDAAPFLFTLLAEMSLADRRRHLDEMVEAWDAYQKTVPYHVDFARVGDCEEGRAAEEVSINGRDLFGARILKEDQPWSMYVENGDYDQDRNPFSDFLIRLARELSPGNDAIDYERTGYSGERFPTCKIFLNYRKRLTGGSQRADYALARGHVRLDEIPDRLRGRDEEDNVSASAERTKWLEAKVPDEEWAKRPVLKLGPLADSTGVPEGRESEDADHV